MRKKNFKFILTNKAFMYETAEGITFRATRTSNERYTVTWFEKNGEYREVSIPYTKAEVESYLKDGIWEEVE